MGYTSLVSKILLSFIISSFVLYRYGNWYRHHIFVTLTVLLAWFCSFCIVFALPLDVVSTLYRQCLQEHPNSTLTLTTNISNSTPIPPKYCFEPLSHVPDKVFPNLWRTVYWSTQCLTWLIMPMMQSYIKAGDFTVKGKLKSAIIDNAIYYGSYLLICGVLLIYLALKPGIDLDWPKLKAIASSASNTWGLFLLVLLLGYALVEVPRKLWKNSDRSYTLSHHYFLAAKLSSDKCEAEETVDDVLESLQAVSLAVRPGQMLHKHLETILQKVPTELRDRMSRRQLPEDTPTDMPTEKALVRLHKQAIKSLQVLQRTENQWNRLVMKIFDLEDTLKNQVSRDRRFKKTFEKEKGWLSNIQVIPVLEWYWKCLIFSYYQKGLAIICGILSACVVWSELTFFNIYPPLSIFALMVYRTKEHYTEHALDTIELVSTCVMLYLCYCAFSTVLKIRVLNIYYLAPHHQTNEYSLIFSGMMLSRLTPPLCLNFLGLIHMDSHVIKSQVMETYYTQIMGHMDVIGIISHGFNIYFPMAILLFCLATYFSLGSRFLSMIGFHQFIGDDEMTTDLIEEGRELIKREKRKLQRAEESSNRRKEFQERFPTTGRFRQSRNSTDTIRPMTQLENMEGTRSNLLRGSSFESTRYTSDDVDTRFPPDEMDIDARFGASTHINERFNNSPEFETTYQMGSGQRTRVVISPRGIFDDV
ncbi:LMBR1 domain-containing protein 2 homolog [Aethina tumida]|uniref:LMBR1 domain-containing protein 2 homolog n=1 Tax=Aethina tumida TaxID=116153 RepID=UPI00096B108A|nr:LMBR1 domain-containing protein 2 homolog [Aethina tumida]